MRIETVVPVTVSYDVKEQAEKIQCGDQVVTIRDECLDCGLIPDLLKSIAKGPHWKNVERFEMLVQEIDLVSKEQELRMRPDVREYLQTVERRKTRHKRARGAELL